MTETPQEVDNIIRFADQGLKTCTAVRVSLELLISQAKAISDMLKARDVLGTREVAIATDKLSEADMWLDKAIGTIDFFIMEKRSCL